MKRMVALVFAVLGAGLVSLVYQRSQPHDHLQPPLDAAGLMSFEEVGRGSEATQEGLRPHEAVGRPLFKRLDGQRAPGGADEREEDENE